MTIRDWAGWLPGMRVTTTDNEPVRVKPKRRDQPSYEELVQSHAAAVAEAEVKYFSDKDAILKGYIDQHAEDVAAYVFECRKHGNFLAIEVTRGKQKFATAINLTESADIRPADGSSPDMNGWVSYHIQYGEGEDGEWKTEAHPSSYWSDNRSRIFSIDKDDKSHGMGFSNQAYVQSKNMPRAAEDDTIRFNGARATLYVPFGLGRGVYEKILAALSGESP